MQTTAIARLQLSQEEILYLISLFKVGTLLGMGDAPIEQYPENERDAVLRAGFNSLQARELLNFQSETKTVELDTFLLALFSTCSSSQYMIYIGRIPVNDMPEVTYFYKKERLVVSHELSGSDLHSLTAYFDSSSTKDSVFAKLRLNENVQAVLINCELESSKFDALLKLMFEEKMDESTTLCHEAGLSEINTNLLIDILQTMRANSTLASITFDEKRAVSQGELYAWVESDKGIVRVETIEKDGKEFVRLSPLSAHELEERIPVWLHLE